MVVKKVKQFYFFVYSIAAVCTIFCAGIPLAGAAQSAMLLSTYQVSLREKEDLIITQGAGYQSGFFVSRALKTTMLAQDYPPQSIDSARKRAAEMGVTPEAVKTIRWRDRALFHFEADQQTHVYSTDVHSIWQKSVWSTKRSLTLAHLESQSNLRHPGQPGYQGQPGHPGHKIYS
jgi:hypothetical protein